MAAAVLSTRPTSHEIMAPSPLAPNAVRHGRGRHGGSVSKNKGRGRGYSIISEREMLISRALVRILRRNEEMEQHQSIDEKLEPDANGWLNCDDVLAHPYLAPLQVTFDELEALTIPPKAKFTLKLRSPSCAQFPGEFNPTNYQVRSLPMNPATASSTIVPAPHTPLSLASSDLPELIVYETSYANYPLIIASGGLKRAGGQTHLSLKPISLVQATELPPITADISIYIDLRSALAIDSSISWFRSEAGMILTEGDADGRIPKFFWKKVVARRTDIGILFEDGEAKKEVPIGLRGKGIKPKKGGKGRGKGSLEMRTCNDDEAVSDQKSI
ncbi:hypothetical protein K3495_g9410 [Podosphaera aphanis]|nr:hypothetical protein K3495_g9410 [Podosphaera aphanis]